MMAEKNVLKKGYELFSKEAERWYRIMSHFKVPVVEIAGGKKPASKKPSKAGVRLSFASKAKSIQSKLVYLYGEQKGNEAFKKIEGKMASFVKKKPRKLKYQDAHFNPLDRFTHKDAVLITYPDSFQEKGQPPLKSLGNFSDRWLKGTINTIHILPFYPYSSDRGFSVKNYKKVYDRLGSWEDINKISGNGFNLMFDGVFNHVSAQSLWFKQFLKRNPIYANHFIEYPSRSVISKEDMKRIVRPRTSDLLTEFMAKDGKTYVWTTFSPDQVDLNYKEPIVLLRIIDVLFRYVRNGATMVRLDAINYIWKELGTSCVHLKQTHVIIQLLRDILDIVAPSVSLVTETNVPHAYNIRYFGNGRNEAQMVYNFALPPLVLYTIYKGNARQISRWADRLEGVSEYCTYFNFLASHDGIGVMPLQRLIPKKEVSFLVKTAKKHGSLVQYKNNGDGSIAPYELNITWWNAINDDKAAEDGELKISRYMASLAIALSIKGVPGIYFHSLFGSGNDLDTYQKTKHNRDINRKNLSLEQVEKELSDESDAPAMGKILFERYTDLIRIRAHNKAFHPDSAQQILMANDHVFSLIRTSLDRKEKMLVLINITAQPQAYLVNCKSLGLSNDRLYDVINKRNLMLTSENIRVNEFELMLKPYEVLWLRSTEKDS